MNITIKLNMMNKYPSPDAICKVETFKIDYIKNFNNFKTLEILPKENFIATSNISKPIINGLLAEFAKENGFEIYVPKSLFKHSETLKPWLLDFNFDILDFMCISPMIYYLLADLYQLVLGNHAPNVQLINFDNEIALGIEFIDNFQSLKNTNQICKIEGKQEDFYNCMSTTFANYYTIAALNIITGDSDLHEDNLGIILPISSPTILAKIDHDKNICDKNLSFQDKILKSLGCNSLNKDSVNNLDCLAKGMSNLASIPNDLWQKTINRRWEKLNEIKPLMSNKTQTHLKFIEELKNDLLEVKYKIPHFEETLTLEHFILQNDVYNLNNYLFFQNIDINQEYEFVGLNSKRTNFSFFEKVAPSVSTPMEYAESRGKLNLYEFFKDQDNNYVPEFYCRLSDNMNLIGTNQHCLTDL